MKLMAPDTDERMALAKSYGKKGDKAAQKIEMEKLKTMRRNHGIYPMISLVNLF